jgi:hypothetical protein
MGRPTMYQTRDDKNAAKALGNRQARTRKAEREHNLLSRHPDQTAVLSRGQARKRFLEEIKEDRVQLLPLPIPTVPEVAGNDEHCEDVESGMNYLINKLITENEERPVEGQLEEDDSLQSSDDGNSFSLLTKFVGMENDAVLGNRNKILSQTMKNLFAPLPESESGFPTCNEWLRTDDDFPTLQQLVSRRLIGVQSVQTSSIPDETQQSLKPQDQWKSKKRRAKLNRSQKQQKKM